MTRAHLVLPFSITYSETFLSLALSFPYIYIYIILLCLVSAAVHSFSIIYNFFRPFRQQQSIGRKHTSDSTFSFWLLLVLFISLFPVSFFFPHPSHFQLDCDRQQTLRQWRRNRPNTRLYRIRAIQQVLPWVDSRPMFQMCTHPPLLLRLALIQLLLRLAFLQ